MPIATANAAAADAHLIAIGNLSPWLRDGNATELTCSAETARETACRHSGHTARWDRTRCRCAPWSPCSVNATKVSAGGCSASAAICWAVRRCFVMSLKRSKLPQFWSLTVERTVFRFLRLDQQLRSCFLLEVAAESARPEQNHGHLTREPLPLDGGSFRAARALFGCACAGL